MRNKIRCLWYVLLGRGVIYNMKIKGIPSIFNNKNFFATGNTFIGDYNG